MASLTPFGIASRKLRLDKSLKLLDVAQKIGVTSAFLSAVETGRKAIPDGFLLKISRALNLSTDEIKDLRRAVDKTRTEVRVDRKDEHQRELIAAFARQLDDVPQSMLDELKKIVLKSISGEIPFQRKRRGIFVPPLSTPVIRSYAEKIRSIFVSDSKVEFPIIDVIELAMIKIDPDFVFDVQDSEAMGLDEGRVPIGNNELVLRLDVYERACSGSPRDIFTAAHEFAHYLMHRKISFARAREDNDKIYCDSEWQADTFAATLLMSQRHAARFANSEEMASACGVSKNAAEVTWQKYVSEGVL